MSAKSIHIPVMSKEVVSFLDPNSDKTIVDMTMGAAGHTIELARLGANIIAIDRDSEIISYAKTRIHENDLDNQVKIHKSEFSKVSEIVKDKVDGFLFDLGVSSLQIDEPGRGFSFNSDGPLDMRMDSELTVPAADLVNALGKKELEELFIKYGEESYAKKIAQIIIEKRKEKPFSSTKELARLIESKIPRSGKIHPATKVFQALRIAVNDELNELKAALPSALSLLKKGGVCVVISFHSLEDRIVKNIFTSQSEDFKLLTPTPVMPSEEEISKNPRSRSAKLRAIRKEK